MKHPSCVLIILALCVLCFVVVQCAGEDGEIFTKENEERGKATHQKRKESVRIGVTHRPEDCTKKTKNGDKLQIHYTGTLKQDGSKFDSSLDRGTPFSFKLGSGQVIKGWEQGLLGMCVGEKRRLTIPPSLGYGDRGAPPKIPGGATLVFETELLAIE